MRVERAIQWLRELSEGRCGTTAVRPKLELYQRTLRELDEATPAADDQGVLVLVEWIESYADVEGRLPPSKAVRERAAGTVATAATTSPRTPGSSPDASAPGGRRRRAVRRVRQAIGRPRRRASTGTRRW